MTSAVMRLPPSPTGLVPCGDSAGPRLCRYMSLQNLRATVNATHGFVEPGRLAPRYGPRYIYCWQRAKTLKEVSLRANTWSFKGTLAKLLEAPTPFVVAVRPTLLPEPRVKSSLVGERSQVMTACVLP